MCGLAGIITKTSKPFDYTTFCTLGIANDSRGGDSCGVFIDGQVEYGVNKDQKYFSGLFFESKLINNTDTSTIALVHCRKASVGKISQETAQPVILKNKDGEIEFVVMHNGTILNYESLAKQYIPNINIKGMTDSQVIARIFYYCGYKVLNEYIGGAVFIIIDYRNGSPQTLLFKGGSKKYAYSNNIEDERPLYYCIDSAQQELVFSSVGIYLLACRKDLRTFSIKSNTLFEFTGTGLKSIFTYDRSNKVQNKTSSYLTSFNDYYDEECNIYKSDYISINLFNNTFTYNCNKIHGKLAISNYGKVDSKHEQLYDIWFFHGVSLKNKNCFLFLKKLHKKSGLSLDIFFNRFQNVIRFLSIDELYRLNNIWVKAITPTKYEIFSGIYNPITALSFSRINNGIRISSEFAMPRKSIKDLLPSECKLNFNEIQEECKLLMKSQEN